MKFKVLSCAVLFCGVSWAEVPAHPSSGIPEAPELRLFQACVEKSGGSTLVSPFSLYETLRYLLPGAGGETKKQIQAVLPRDGAVRKDLAFLSGEDSRFLRCYSACRIFVDGSVELKPDYVKAVGRECVAPAPFLSDKPEAVRQVNAWAAKNTENRIIGLLSPERVSDRTVVVLVNAMYMRAFWDSKFERKDTKIRPFFREDGSSSNVSMMKQQVFTEGREWPAAGGKYYEKDGVRGASLFLSGGKNSPVFMAVLPPEGKKLKQFVADMSADEWNGVLAALSDRGSDEANAEADKKSLEKRLEERSRYHLRLPRFSVSSPSVSLKKILMDMGMRNAFSDDADFSHMGSVSLNPLMVMDVYQKSMIRVREDGLEAAASSGSDMEPFAGTPPIGQGPAIEFNRPFLWLIYSPGNRAVLVAGTYAGPSAGR